MCYCKNSLKSSLINDLQNNSIILQLRVLGLIGKFITGPWMKIFYSNSECKANLEMVPVIKICIMTLRDLIQKPTFFLTATSNIFGEKLSEEDETLLCLQAPMSSDEESKFHEVMSLAVRSTVEVLEHQLEPYLHGSLSRPSKDMLVKSQTAPVHNMLSEQTLGLVDYHVRHAPNANMDFIDGKVKCAKNQTLLWLQGKADEIQEKLILFAIKRVRFTWKQRKANDELRIQIQHYRLQEEQSKQDKVFRGKTEIKVKSILANECKIEEQFPQISSDTLEFIKIVVKNPSWLLGKYIEQEWNISPGINKKYNGKVLLIKNSKQGIKLIISYWKLEESEDDGEDESITLVQFVTYVIHKDLVVLV